MMLSSKHYFNNDLWEDLRERSGTMDFDNNCYLELSAWTVMDLRYIVSFIMFQQGPHLLGMVSSDVCSCLGWKCGWKVDSLIWKCSFAGAVWLRKILWKHEPSRTGKCAEGIKKQLDGFRRSGMARVWNCVCETTERVNCFARCSSQNPKLVCDTEKQSVTWVLTLSVWKKQPCKLMDNYTTQHKTLKSAVLEVSFCFDFLLLILMYVLTEWVNSIVDFIPNV